VVGIVLGVGLAHCLTSGAAAEQASPPGLLDWLVGSWSEAKAQGAPPLSGRHFAEATFERTGTGVRGRLRDVGPGGVRSALADYTIALADGRVSLRVVERGVSYRLKGTASSGYIRFERSSSKPGTILVEFSILHGQLLVRHSYGPQHGKAVEATYALASVSAMAD
jgi:hypothetical protein